MTIEEYKEFIVQKLGMAGECEETEQIINSSIDLQHSMRHTLSKKTD